MKKTWIAAGILAALSVGIQVRLDRTAEKQEEDRYTRIADLKATRILPQYIASLFMGSFRAVVVDVLWVQLRRMKEEEHRYFETVEIMDMIAQLQPRNPEVWVNQAWDAAYNIANHVRNPDEQWKWIKYALEKLEEGSRQMPNDPYLKFELGRVLVHKATWKEGHFHEPYTTQSTKDDALRAKLGRGGGRTPFELALPWFEAALEDLRVLKEEQRWKFLRGTSGEISEDRDWHTTQIGLNIHPSTVDGNIYLAKFFNAFYFWRVKGDRPEAAKWFRAAADHARGILKRHGRSSPIFHDYAALCDALAKAAEKPAGTREEKEALLRELTPVLLAAGTKEYFYLYRMLSELKKELGGDALEFNDGLDHAQGVDFEKLVEATLFPAGDIDGYVGYARQPEAEAHDHAGHAHGEHAHEKPAFPPHRVAFQVKKDGDCDLAIELWTFKDRLLQKAATMELKEKRWAEIEGVTDTAGHFILYVRALDGDAKPKNPAYLLRWSLVEPIK